MKDVAQTCSRKAEDCGTFDFGYQASKQSIGSMYIMPLSVGSGLGTAAAMAKPYISSRSIILALLLIRNMLGKPDKSLVLVQSQVEAYILTLFTLAFIRVMWTSLILPIHTSSWNPLSHTST